MIKNYLLYNICNISKKYKNLKINCLYFVNKETWGMSLGHKDKIPFSMSEKDMLILCNKLFYQYICKLQLLLYKCYYLLYYYNCYVKIHPSKWFYENIVLQP